MARIVTSARGERVDFDLLAIKQSMAATPSTDNTAKRERFINKKRRRGMKRRVDEMAQNKRLEEANFAANAAPVVASVQATEVDSGENDEGADSIDNAGEAKKRKVKQ
jgi:hypothetical protein